VPTIHEAPHYVRAAWSASRRTAACHWSTYKDAAPPNKRNWWAVIALGKAECCALTGHGLQSTALAQASESPAA